MENGILALIKMVQDAAPWVLAAARQGVQARIVGDWLWIAFGAAMIALGVFFAWFGWRAVGDTGEDNWFCMFFPAAFLLIFGLIFVLSNASDLIYCYRAPDYAALKVLIELIPKK